MLQTKVLESAICEVLARVGTCTLEELNERVPYASWNQTFAAVDRLNREGTVTLQRANSSDYVLSLAPPRTPETNRMTPS